MIFIRAVITCSLLPPLNGNITFSAAVDGGYPFDATATYSCNAGYSLMPSPTIRTCRGDSSSVVGLFDGIEPICQG